MDIHIYIHIYTSKPGIFKDISVKTPIHLPQTKTVKLNTGSIAQYKKGTADMISQIFENSMRVVVSDTFFEMVLLFFLRWVLQHCTGFARLV